MKTDTQYVLYLGTNDKDSNMPVFTPEEAQKKANVMIEEFHQSSVMIQANQTVTEFYAGE